MKVRFVVTLLVAILLSSCGAKKRTTSSRVDTSSKRIAYQPNSGIEGTNYKKEALYPMPEDPGSFKQFNIISTEDYVDSFKEIAQYEMKAFGIPASITLAQGILESASGRGELTKKTNNHFGIKCHSGWQGEYDFHDDDAKGECFRKYNHPMYSFRDHSIFLASRSRYRFLFNYSRDDYKKWAYGLKKAGYATDPKYPQKLITLIERYNLDIYDQQVVQGGLDTVRKPKQFEVFSHTVEKGDTLYAISKKYAVSVDEIIRLNNLKSTTISIGQVLNLRRESSN
ncbi:glucosaminidase domain-containing protein [Croceivirga thetidis]|uniref:Peptidoglycan hydrolase n=1 Tax=Croceivirga thetidis TaxID=2721623 RepID=A0ABX1GPE3_9FLAO|nr:glucosaminidase domain-containing protein [Croceivirga thetidis]NKI31790.1 LysM peptidoglycan-binding domain-containing protein [Croceivirga thetidis]